jgi:hypothetical protein
VLWAWNFCQGRRAVAEGQVGGSVGVGGAKNVRGARRAYVFVFARGCCAEFLLECGGGFAVGRCVTAPGE